MSSVITLVHWSDLHVGIVENEARLEALVSWTVANLAPSTTAIAITGDLTEDGGGAQYRRAVELLRPLVRAGFRLLPVPGNHDCGPRGIKWNEAARRRWDHYVWSRLLGVKAPSKYPHAVDLGAWRVLLLDSQEGNSDDLIVMARGELGQPQIARLEVALQDHLHKPHAILLHHHPISADLLHALDEAEEVVELLGRRGVELVLFGHMHKRATYTGHAGILHAADAGQTVEVRGGALEFTAWRLAPDRSATPHVWRVPV